jgi:hypothetical protein
VNREVSVAQWVFEKATSYFAETRSATGAPSEYDFAGGPLAAALFAFRAFDTMTYDLVPAVRSHVIVDPFFGALVFVAVLLTDGSVEVADFDLDADYWDVVADEVD